ncbi:hypothetical protein PIB30_042418 [Stylosanthes scabra]|uniref:Uncharacterized protein n=1 Tax=Stylosanthes scabra TaxID=79078 RepID=A0ABU6QFA0_9FABA|nr:hypothetical protein [Stylosanthes scabra]
MAVAKLQGYHNSKRYDRLTIDQLPPRVDSLSSASISISREDEARNSSSESSSLASFFSIGVPSLQFPLIRIPHSSNIKIAERVPNSASALAMSSWVGLLPAPDDYLGSNPSMVASPLAFTFNKQDITQRLESLSLSQAGRHPALAFLRT